MKRVFATAGFSFVFSLLLLNTFISDYAVIFSAVVFSAFILSLFIPSFKRKKEISCIFLSCALSAAVFAIVTEYSYKPQMKYVDTKCEIEATVLDFPSMSSGGNYGYTIKTEKINGEEKHIRMKLYTPYETCAEPYDKVAFSSYPFVPGSNNKSTFDYFRAKRTYLGAYTRFDVRVYEPQKKPFISYFFDRRKVSEENIRKNLPDDYAGFAIGILFGDKAYISEESKDSFRLAGLSHIMAVSGLHLSVWVMGLFFLMRKAGFDDRVSGAVSIFAAWCLVFFCAFSVSVIRAAVMVTVYLSAPFFRRRADSLNSLGLAAFIICAVNPYAVCDVSFLLSFFATLGIIVFSSCFPFFFKRAESRKFPLRLLRYFTGVIAASFSACVFTVPVLIKYFSALNTWSLLGNIAVSFAVMPCLLLSGILSVCGSVNFIAYPVKTALYYIETYIFTVVSKISSLPFASILCDSTIYSLLLPLVLIAAVFTVYSVRKKEFSSTALIISAASLTLTLSQL